MKRKVRAGQTAPGPRNPSTGQDRNWNGKCWYFCQSCRARVRRDHKMVRGFTCPGPIYEMDGYVQIPRKAANDRQWRLWMTKFCQPFRLAQILALMLLIGCVSVHRHYESGDTFIRYIDGTRIEYTVLSETNGIVCYALHVEGWPDWGQPGGIRETGTLESVRFSRFMRLNP